MLQILFSILAGILTVASPCILPLLPILLGMSVGQTDRRRPLFIVFGFIISFSALGLVLSFLSIHSGFNTQIIRNIGVVLLAFFGILLLLPNLYDKLAPLLSKFVNSASQMGKSQNNFGAFILGATLGIVWTPCAGPVLGAILTLIATQKNLLSAGILLFFYSVGASVPMLLIAYGGQYATTKVRFLNNYTQIIQKVFGILIILLALAIYFQYDIKIYSILSEKYPIFNSKY